MEIFPIFFIFSNFFRNIFPRKKSNALKKKFNKNKKTGKIDIY